MIHFSIMSQAFVDHKKLGGIPYESLDPQKCWDSQPYVNWVFLYVAYNYLSEILRNINPYPAGTEND